MNNNINTSWIDNLYRPFEGRLSCGDVLDGLKRDGMFVFENAFDTATLRRIITEIRKAVKGTGFDSDDVPSKVSGILKLDNDFPDEPIFWYLRMVIESFFQRFLGSKHNLVSFDTMNETYDTNRIDPKPHVDVLFGGDVTDAIQCIFQFKIRVINDGKTPEDFSVIEDDDEDGSGFNYYRGSNDPLVREALMTKFPEIDAGTWMLPSNTVIGNTKTGIQGTPDTLLKSILAYLQDDLDCPKKTVTKGNTIIFFDGALVHHAGSSQKHVVDKRMKRDPSICRLAVYASVQRLCEVPMTDIKQRIQWLYESAVRKGTGHRIKDPNDTKPRYYKNQEPLRAIFKKNYVHKVKMVSLVPGSSKNRLLRATTLEKGNPFDFSAFGITNLRSFENKMTQLSGVAYLNLDAVSQYDLVASEKLEPYFAHNYLQDFNAHKQARLELGLDGLFERQEAPLPKKEKRRKEKKEKKEKKPKDGIVRKSSPVGRSMMDDSDDECL